LIFTVECDKLSKALTSIQVKGKGSTNSGFGNTSLGSYVMLIIKDNTLSIWNGNNTFFVKLDIQLDEEINTRIVEGTCVVDTTTLLPYLKTFGDIVTFNVGDFIALNGANKKASIPIVVNHPSDAALVRIKNMLNHVRYEIQPQTLFGFGKSSFEGAFTLTQPQLQSAIKNCELVKNGVYKFDYNENLLTVSSRENVTNKYEETITPVFPMGEPATVEFSSPVYAFFEKDQMINVYMKDEFPLLLVANDRMLLKAPTVNG